MYTLRRAPEIALTTKFRVDRFHQQGHSCSKEFHLKPARATCEGFINSSAVEQLWSKMRNRIASSVASMSLDHALLAFRYFMAVSNRKLLNSHYFTAPSQDANEERSGRDL